ncbi:hypothetical protein [Haloarchaeobius sp. TZWWS8]|uniref:hypothetical protein n=1 Tax=Haloarchaeobius sp. TZWWS8 TaxID=3446121 RepID=UPI003EB88A60
MVVTVPSVVVETSVSVPSVVVVFFVVVVVEFLTLPPRQPAVPRAILVPTPARSVLLVLILTVSDV